MLCVSVWSNPELPIYGDGVFLYSFSCFEHCHIAVCVCAAIVVHDSQVNCQSGARGSSASHARFLAVIGWGAHHIAVEAQVIANDIPWGPQDS